MANIDTTPSLLGKERSILKRIRTILSVVIIVALLLSSGLPFGEQPTAAADGEGLDLPPIELPDKGNPKLDSQLNQLVSAQTSKRAASFAQESNIELVDDNVRVIVECLPSQVDAAAKAGGALGVVETSYRNLLQIVVPISSLTALADAPGVRLVRVPWYPLPDVISEGVEVINADEVQTAGYTGAGVKVAILDGGFSGYTTRQSEGELPATVTTWWAPSIGGPGTSVHGTACAEIVYDIAPDADFYLVNFGTEVEMGNAVNWLIAQEVDVISYSIGWPTGGPGDGTGLICEMVGDARDGGILWSQSIGNAAERHWQGDFVDTEPDEWHEFFDGDETNEISVNEGELIIVALKWDDTWGASASDYDLYLFDSSLSTPVWGSTDIQDGDDDPVEGFGYIATYSGVYHIAIDGYFATATTNFHLYSYRHNLEYQVASSSFSIPADSPNAMAVGAVPWDNPTTLEPFSSRGPTEIGLIKPDLVAPDGVSTVTYGATAFDGTSASAPHAAGAAALLLDKNPAWSVTQVRYALESTAVDRGASGQDNLYGWGLIDDYAAVTGFDPPTMEPIAEAEEQYYNAAPSFSNFGFDDDVALGDGWHQMDSYAGTWTALFTDVAGTSWDNDGWTIPGFDGLAEGSHTIYFKASDDTGSVEGESGEWSWQFFKDTTVPTVGGTIVLVDKLGLVMPWIIVAALMVVAGIWLGIWDRRRRIGSPSGR